MATSQLLEMMGDWSFITLKMVSWWVQNPMIQSGETMVTWLPGYLVTWLPCDPSPVTREPGYLVTWLPGYMVTLVPGYLVTWLSENLVT